MARAYSDSQLALSVERRILSLRGHRILLDYDLASLYGVETRALKQAVKRNLDRFPPDFMFELSAAEIEEAALTFGMDVLIEVHDEAELDRALALKSPLIGINNRNLHTFELTLDTTRRLSRLIPPDRHLVCESGLYTPADLAEMSAYGARRFLIGESLMRQDDVQAATAVLLADPVPA